MMRPLYTALLATAVAGAMIPVVRKLRQRNGANGRDSRRLDRDRSRDARASYTDRRESVTAPLGTPTSTFR